MLEQVALAEEYQFSFLFFFSASGSVGGRWGPRCGPQLSWSSSGEYLVPSGS